MSDTRTPAWWCALPAQVQVLVLSVLLPGVVAHELVHALVAWRQVDTIDWDDIAVVFDRDADAALMLAVAHIAPLLSGYAVAVGTLLAVGSSGGVRVPTALQTAVGATGVAGIAAYIVANYLLFTVASMSDVAVCWHYLQTHRSQTESDQKLTRDT